MNRSGGFGSGSVNEKVMTGQRHSCHGFIIRLFENDTVASHGAAIRSDGYQREILKGSCENSD